MDKERLIEALKRHEGVELKMYQDTVSKWTVGIGRNIEDNGISMDEAELMLSNDLVTAESEARILFNTFDTLNDVRQEVICNMLFNLGRPRLGQFKKMLAALEVSDFETAADEAKDSRWFNQIKGRGRELVWQLRNGEIGTIIDWDSEE